MRYPYEFMHELIDHTRKPGRNVPEAPVSATAVFGYSVHLGPTVFGCLFEFRCHKQSCTMLLLLLLSGRVTLAISAPLDELVYDILGHSVRRRGKLMELKSALFKDGFEAILII